MGQLPRITFGIIVLNGQPFVRYNLRALYPFAHEIIVVEGASPYAVGTATPDGHSTDGTLEALHAFKAHEDPEGKVQIITRDGFWSEKDEQSRAYAERATGQYMWQVDIDEFYKPEDMQTVVDMLAADPEITAVSFEGIFFWGGLDYTVTSGIMWRPCRNTFRRVFKWGPGYRYVAHRPPTVEDELGRDMIALKPVGKRYMAKKGIFLYHYYAVFPDQVMQKSLYYKHMGWKITKRMDNWAANTWLHLKQPFRVYHAHPYLSWLQRFKGAHPPQIEELRTDVSEGHISIQMRDVSDIEDLLSSRWYKLCRPVVQAWEYARSLASRIWYGARRRVRRAPLMRMGVLYMRAVKQGLRLLLASAHQTARYEWLGQRFPAKPIVLQLPITDVCNSRCVMCSVWQSQRDREITVEELEQILDDPLFSEIRYVGISGGEPTLRSDLPDIGRVLVESLPKLRGIEIITNALRPRLVLERVLALAEVLQAANIPFGVSVSLDGIGDDHDRNRGVKGNFASAIEVIDALRPAELPVSIGCTLTPLNCYAADDVLLWCEQNDIQGWSFRLGVEIKRLHNEAYGERYRFTAEQRLHLAMFFDKLVHHARVDSAHRRFYRSLVNQLASGTPRRAGCSWQSRGVTLDARGNISYCSVQSPILGSALERSAWQIYLEGLNERDRIVREHCDDCQHDLLGAPSGGAMAREGARMVAEPWRQQWRRLTKRFYVRGAPRSILPADRDSPAEWRHVLITGWYGTETAGDKAILAELLHFLQTYSPGCQVTVTTLDGMVSRQTRMELPELEHVTIVEMDGGHDPALIESIDAVIVGGGPLQEIPQMEYIWRMFVEANRQRKSRIIFGCGIGPLHTDRLRQMVADICHMTTAGFLRDPESRESAVEMGAPRSLACGCDPALAYVRRWVASVTQPLHGLEPPCIAGLLRANTNEYIVDMTAAELDDSNALVARELAQVLEFVCQRRGAKAELLPMHTIWTGGDDRIFSRELADCLGDPNCVRVERRYLPLETLLQSLYSAHAAVVMRYHAHLFCMALGIPFLSIDYSGKPGKVHSLIQRIAFDQWTEEWRGIDVSRASSRLERLLDERARWSAYLREQTDGLVTELHQAYAEVFGVPEAPV